MSKGQGKNSETRRVEVFRPGTFRAMNGQEYSFSDADVLAMASAYDPVKAPAPVVVGHPKHDDPAFGWAQGFEINDDGTLIAELGDLAPEFVDAVAQGRYRKVSMKFFPPDAPSNPSPGAYYPRHVGFLGGAAPAVSGLAPVQFVEGDDGLIEIAFSLEDVTESTASIMRRVREFFIEKFGLEAADQAVPEYHIRWIEEAGQEPASHPGFTDPEQEEEKTMGDDTTLKAREAELAKRERALVHAENVSFADNLIETGKLLPVQKNSVIALLDQLSSDGEAEIAFSDDGTEKKSAPAQLFKDILSAQPEVVPAGKTDLGEDAPGASVAFSAPDGMAVDGADLETHGKALAYQRQNPGTDYIAAVLAVQQEG